MRGVDQGHCPYQQKRHMDKMLTGIPVRLQEFNMWLARFGLHRRPLFKGQLGGSGHRTGQVLACRMSFVSRSGNVILGGTEEQRCVPR